MILLKQELIHIVNIFFLSHKGKNTPQSDVLVPDAIKLLTSSGNVLLCGFGSTHKYVRLIRKHTSLKEYIAGSIDLFFDLHIMCSNIECFRKKAHSDLEEYDNYLKIKRIESTVQSNVKKLASREFIDVSLFGFPSLYATDFYPFASAFILFLRGEMASYLDNKKLIAIKKAYLQTFSYNLQCATKKLACLLGIGDLIPNIEIRLMEINKKRYVVSVMDPSLGIPANEITMEKRHELTPRFLRSLSNLDYLDSICYQTDHKQRNYTVSLEKDGKLGDVSAFDNDAPLTFLPVFAFPQKVSLVDGYTPVYKKGKINRRFMDSLLAKKLCTLGGTQIYNELSDCLNLLQIASVWFRIKKIKGCLIKQRKYNPSFTIDFNDDIDVSKFVIESGASCYDVMDYLTYFQINNEKERYKHIKI